MSAIIVAVDENNGIGYKGQLLEHIPEDMKQFKELTTEGGFVVMGKRTYDSLPYKPLSGRKNYVITHHPENFKNNISVEYISMEEAIRLVRFGEDCLPKNMPRFFVIGGAQIYKALLPYCKDIYLTKILKTYEKVDAFFPNLSNDEWSGEIFHTGDYQGLKYQFWHYSRNS